MAVTLLALEQRQALRRTWCLANCQANLYELLCLDKRILPRQLLILVTLPNRVSHKFTRYVLQIRLSFVLYLLFPSEECISKSLRLGPVHHDGKSQR